MSALLETVNLKKWYRMGSQTLEVLRGVSLQIHAGELAVIVGPSGAGKSTLLHLLGGLDRPSGGEVLFEGKSLSGMAEREVSLLRNSAFGFVFQFYHLVPELTALENVMLPAWIGRSRADVQKRAGQLLEQVGLSVRADHLPAELSGGEQQRVAIARALMNKPRAVFCDEPTGNLDSATGEGILKLLLHLNKEQGTTLVVVTHEPAITRVARKLFSLKDGQLWA
jgi:lipoprotein-releasing system ATP-binding protein